MRDYDLLKQHMKEQLQQAETDRLIKDNTASRPLVNRLRAFFQRNITNKADEQHQPVPVQTLEPTHTI